MCRPDHPHLDAARLRPPGPTPGGRLSAAHAGEGFESTQLASSTRSGSKARSTGAMSCATTSGHACASVATGTSNAATRRSSSAGPRCAQRASVSNNSRPASPTTRSETRRAARHRTIGRKRARGRRARRLPGSEWPGSGTCRGGSGSAEAPASCPRHSHGRCWPGRAATRARNPPSPPGSDPAATQFQGNPARRPHSRRPARSAPALRAGRAGRTYSSRNGTAAATRTPCGVAHRRAALAPKSPAGSVRNRRTMRNGAAPRLSETGLRGTSARKAARAARCHTSLRRCEMSEVCGRPSIAASSMLQAGPPGRGCPQQRISPWSQSCGISILLLCGRGHADMPAGSDLAHACVCSMPHARSASRRQ